MARLLILFLTPVILIADSVSAQPQPSSAAAVAGAGPGAYSSAVADAGGCVYPPPPPEPEHCCPDNERWNPSPPCKPDSCDLVYSTKEYQCFVKPQPRCTCIDGYCRNSNGDCVPVKDCDTTPKCGKYEKWDCRRLPCNDDLCSNIVSKKPCKENCKCTKRCYCIPGYYRETAGGKCIPKCECKCMKNSPECCSCKKPKRYDDDDADADAEE